jgi:hypothetical protein
LKYLEDVQLKRQEIADKKAVKTDKVTQIVHEKQLNEAVTKAINETHADTKKHREQTTIKVQVTNPKTEVDNLPDMALREDITNLTQAIKGLESSLKPESVEFDPIVSALSTLGDKLDTLPKEYPEVEKVEEVSVNNLSELKDAFLAVVDAINSKDYKPVFKPNISVESPKIDLTPITQVLKDEEDEFEFGDFVAQDIDNDSDSVQYVGLQSPDGKWCFIENDFTSLRYAFGTDNYSKSWSKHTNYSYTTIAEAINAIRT